MEKKVGKGEWVKALPNLVSGTEAVIPNLPFGSSVEFRVAAVNDGGPGDFSRATQPQLIKDKTSRLTIANKYYPKIVKCVF